MKITKRQLRRIIREENACLQEGFWKQREVDVVQEIVELLIERGAIMPQAGESGYDEALRYLQSAIIPTLQAYTDM